MAGKKQENRGGARDGAGRPPVKKNYSEDFRKGMWAALEKKAKETGKSLQDMMVDMAYDCDPKWKNAQQAAQKQICEVLVTKESHQTIEKKEIGPVIGLPPIKQPEESVMPQVKGFLN